MAQQETTTTGMTTMMMMMMTMTMMMMGLQLNPSKGVKGQETRATRTVA